MRNSEIFEAFVKIAEEKGLISKAESSKEKLEKNPRADSLNNKDIEKLYNVSPETNKDMSYKRNIVELAHPKKAIIGPSYDKLNGLVENVNERQDIMYNIVSRQPTGQLFNKKYAEHQLVMSLVRVANDMDNKEQEELMALADICLEQIKK